MLCQMLCHFAHVTQCREIRLQVAASGSGRPAGDLPFWPATAPSSGIEAHVTTQFFIVAGDLSLSRLSHSDLSVWGIFSWRKLCNSTPLDILFEDPLFGKKFSSGEHHGSTVFFFRNGRVAAVMSPVAGGHEVQHVATFP